MARRSRRPRFPGWLGLLVLLLFLARGWWLGEPLSEPEPVGENEYLVERVVDGDTIIVQGGRRIRLIGVDTPETVKPNSPVEPWGPEASRFTKQFLLTGRVRLQLDKEREDRYRRTLAYVWVGDRMLNEELIRSGLGRAQTQYNFSQSMKRRFEKAEREAKEHRRGIWSSVTPETTSGTPSFLRSKPVRSLVNKALSELLE